MEWSDVGDWLKNNGGNGLTLIGSLLTGNIPAAIASGAAMVSSATGTDDPVKALQSLQDDPQTRVRLLELANQNEASIRAHIESIERIKLEARQAELADAQSEQITQQETIRNGDNATDEYVRRTRPLMARQSWYAVIAYVLGFEALHALNAFSVGAVAELALILIAPAGAYMGFRSWDKRSGVK